VEPITLILLALLAGAGVGAAAVIVEVLSYRAVDRYVSSISVTRGSAQIIRNRLQSGRYEVVVGVFGPAGSKLASQSWDAGQLDSTLEQRFGKQNVIQITT